MATALWKDPQAYEPLVRFAFDFARRVTGHDADAEDLAQEALLELAEAEPSKPAAVGVRALLGRRIVLGAKMLRRANLTRARHERASAKGVEVPAEEGASAREALELLDADDRHAVELRFLHGLSYAEVAHVLGVSEPAARMRVHRALGSLRDRLGPRAEATLAALPLFLAPRSLALQTARAAVLAGGGIAVKKIVVAVVALLALAAGGVVVSRSMRSSPAERAEHAQTPLVAEVVPAEAPPVAASEAPAPPQNPIPPGKGSVFGRIAFEDGEPVRGVCVQLSGSPSTPCMTDDEGRFRIDGEWVATRDLAITEGDALYLRIAKAELRADEAIRIDVVLKRGTLLEGTVAKAGSPVGGAVVQLQRPGAAGARTIQGSFGRAVTDAEGRFAFPFLPDGLYTLFASRDGIEPACAELSVAPGLPPQVLAVRDARPLRFRFVPMPEAWRGKKLLFGIGSVEGKPIDLWHNRAPDERGEITVEAPPPGRWLVRQLPGGHREFEVTEASVPEIVIDLRGARVFGKVSTQCRISVGSEEARTGADGNYEIALVPAGEAEVMLRIASVTIARPRLLVPESGEVRLDVELKGVNVRGRLVAEGDYQRWVTLWRAGRGPFGTVTTGPDGVFAIPFVEAGEYEIWGATTEQQGVHRTIVVGGEDLDVGDLAVDPGPEVPLIVTAPAGVRLAGRYSVWAYNGSERRLVHLSLDEGGQGVIRLPAGKWRVTLGLGGLQQAEVEMDVPPREPVRIDLKR